MCRAGISCDWARKPGVYLALATALPKITMAHIFPILCHLAWAASCLYVSTRRLWGTVYVGSKLAIKRP